jgi:hypothetical protein
VCFKVPGGVIVGERLAGLSPACTDGGRACLAFQTIAVIGATAWEWILIAVVRDADVAHFRMRSPMHQAAIHHPSSADARADREIQKGIQMLRRAPAEFSERCGVDIGVEGNLDPQGITDGAGEIEIPPGQLGRGCYVTEGWRCRIGIDGAKRSDADGADGLVLSKKRDRALNRFFRSSGGDFTNLEIIRLAPDGADKLAAAGFDTPYDWHVFQCTPNLLRTNLV